MTQWFGGMTITAGRLNDGPPTTFTTTGLTLEAGWALNDFRGYRNGRNITLDIYLNRTGATITQTNGNVGDDPLICTVPAGWRPTSGTINGGWDNGASEGGFVVGTDGKCTLRTASSDIGSGTNMRLHADFIIDN